MNDEQKLQQIIEGVLLASGKPMNIEQLAGLFTDEERPDKKLIAEVLDNIIESCEGRGYELKKVASGYRFQVRQDVSEWVARLWEEKPQRYSRALLETLSIIAYRQPLTRGDIEKVRGVAVSTGIMRTLLDREWVRIVGHRDVPGRPSIYATTRQFLDYFNVESLDQLPALAEIRDLDEMNREVNQELTLDEHEQGRAIELPRGEEDTEEFAVLDEEDEAMVKWATQPISAILGEEQEPELTEEGAEEGEEEESADADDDRASEDESLSEESPER